MASSLEELISTKMAALGLNSDEDSCAFVLQMVEEDSFELEVPSSAISEQRQLIDL